MSPLGIRRSMRRLHRHAAGLLLVIALAGAVAVHHSGGGTGGMQHDGMSGAIELCVGALVAVGTAVAAVAIGVLALGRWPLLDQLLPGAAIAITRTRAPEARAGPPPLRSQLCVWRR